MPGTPNVPFGRGMNREIELYVEACLTQMDAIVAATATGAAQMPPLGEADFGNLEAGKVADLIVLILSIPVREFHPSLPWSRSRMKPPRMLSGASTPGVLDSPAGDATMQINLNAIKTKAQALLTKAQALLTPPNFLGATTIALLVIINWDVLLLRYRQFVEWAPWVPPAVAQAYSILISAVVVVALHSTISFLLELVYFGPLKRLNKLEKQAHEKLSRHDGRFFCQSMVLGILTENMTADQRRDLDEFADIVNGRPDGPMKEGALDVLIQLSNLADTE